MASQLFQPYFIDLVFLRIYSQTVKKMRINRWSLCGITGQIFKPLVTSRCVVCASSRVVSSVSNEMPGDTVTISRLTHFTSLLYYVMVTMTTVEDHAFRFLVEFFFLWDSLLKVFLFYLLCSSYEQRYRYYQKNSKKAIRKLRHGTNKTEPRSWKLMPNTVLMMSELSLCYSSQNNWDEKSANRTNIQRHMRELK